MWLPKRICTDMLPYIALYADSPIPCALRTQFAFTRNELINIYYLEANTRINVDKIKQNCLSPDVDVVHIGFPCVHVRSIDTVLQYGIVSLSVIKTLSLLATQWHNLSNLIEYHALDICHFHSLSCCPYSDY